VAKLRITKVTVNLVPGGASQVTVTSDTPLPDRTRACGQRRLGQADGGRGP
jgi:hypothetical protein